MKYFIEVEYHSVTDNENIEKVKEKIRKWIQEKGINVGQELNSGKPELMLKKLDI